MITNFPSVIIACDAAKPWGMYFQDSASPQMEALAELHDNIMFYLVIILFGVGWVMVSIIRNYTKNKISNKYINHGTLIELIWTVAPALILILIAFPSFKLLYLMDEVTDPNLTVFAEGHQWDWSHDYPESFDDTIGQFEVFMDDGPPQWQTLEDIVAENAQFREMARLAELPPPPPEVVTIDLKAEWVHPDHNPELDWGTIQGRQVFITDTNDASFTNTMSLLSSPNTTTFTWYGNRLGILRPHSNNDPVTFVTNTRIVDRIQRTGILRVFVNGSPAIWNEISTNMSHTILIERSRG